MPTDDKKPYRDLLILLGHTGSAASVLNKLHAQMVKIHDPHLKALCDQVVAFFIEKPQFTGWKKFQLLDFAHQYGANSGDYRATSKAINAAREHCEARLASTMPAWQQIALDHGWAPPTRSTP
jgi:hypothetical protein